MEHPAEQDTGQSDPLYAAFLVRCRHSGEQWYFLLENVSTRERRRFESLAALVRYMQAFLQEVNEAHE